MKRVFRITIILIPDVVIIAGIGMWRHHYLKIMNAEPEKVFNNKPVISRNLTTEVNMPKVPPIEGDDNTDVRDTEPSQAIQPIDNSNTIEEIVNTSNSSTDTIFGDLIEQNLPPEAVAALKKYKEAQ